MEALFTLVMPAFLQGFPLIDFTIIVHLEPFIKDRDCVNGVLWKHFKHRLAEITVDFLNLTLTQLVEFIRVKTVLGFFFLSHVFDLVLFLLYHIHGSLILGDLIVSLVHFIFNFEEDIFKLILHFELEALRALWKTRVFLIENVFVQGGPLSVGSTTKAKGTWEISRHFEVRVRYLLKIVSLKFR